MRRYLLIAAGLLALLSPAKAADSTVAAMTAASALSGTELLYTVQGGADRKATPLQMAAYVYGLMSGDATAAAGGAVTFATVNGNVGSFGSATACTAITVNAKGLITAASAVTCTPAMSSVTGRAALSQLPQGIANSIWINPTGSTADMQNLAVPACANDGAHALVYVNGSGLACASITGGGSGTVTSIATSCGVTGGTITTTGTISSNATPRSNTATTDTITSVDCGIPVTESNASPVAVAITTAGFSTGNYFTIKNKGAGLATYTPSSGTINGNATIACAQNQSADLIFDGTNYFTLGNTCQLGSLATITPGANVATAAANALSAAGGLTSTIANGTAALGTGAITAGTCATVVTVAATNVATTDRIKVGFNGDPTATTGYLPTAMLTIVPYPTSGNVNFKVCNLTGSSITPSAVTINWDVQR